MSDTAAESSGDLFKLFPKELRGVVPSNLQKKPTVVPTKSPWSSWFVRGQAGDSHKSPPPARAQVLDGQQPEADHTQFL